MESPAAENPLRNGLSSWRAFRRTVAWFAQSVPVKGAGFVSSLFWGDRMGMCRLTGPDGHPWSFATARTQGERS